MSVPHLVPAFTTKELESFVHNLTKPQHYRGVERSHWGRISIREGVREDVEKYAVSKVLSKAPVNIGGHITVPGGKNLEFGVFVEPSTDQVLIRIRSESLVGYSMSDATREVAITLRQMIEKAKKPLRGGGGGKDKKGFYLKNIGRHGRVAEKARARFDEAERAGLITRAFAESCVTFGFRMTYEKGR